MEMTASLALSRRHGVAEAGEGSAKKTKMEKAAAGCEATPAAAAAQKKTKKVMTAVSKEQVDFVLAAKPIVRRRHSSVLQPRLSEETRRQSAWVDEVVRSNNEILRKLQENYRQQLDTKGCVHIEIEVTDDES